MKVLSVASRFSEQSEAKLITISRIKDASCPYRYYKEHVERPKPTKPFESIEIGLGDLFHSYVCAHFKMVKARDAIISAGDILNTEDLVANFVLSYLWKGRLRAPYKIINSSNSFEDFKDRLHIIGDNFNLFLVEHMLGQRLLEVEGGLQIRSESFYIRGKYDLITKKRSGELVLWDWKTGKVPAPQYFEEFRNQKIQLGFYAVWIRHKYETQNVRGTAVFLRDEYVELSENFTNSVEQEVLAYADNWRRRTNALISYPPIPNGLCRWCGWNPVCPAFE